jgi:hypothetical protein
MITNLIPSFINGVMGITYLIKKDSIRGPNAVSNHRMDVARLCWVITCSTRACLTSRGTSTGIWRYRGVRRLTRTTRRWIVLTVTRATLRSSSFGTLFQFLPAVPVTPEDIFELVILVSGRFKFLFTTLDLLLQFFDPRISISRSRRCSQRSNRR